MTKSTTKKREKFTLPRVSSPVIVIKTKVHDKQLVSKLVRFRNNCWDEFCRLYKLMSNFIHNVKHIYTNMAQVDYGRTYLVHDHCECYRLLQDDQLLMG